MRRAAPETTTFFTRKRAEGGKCYVSENRSAKRRVKRGAGKTEIAEKKRRKGLVDGG